MMSLFGLGGRCGSRSLDLIDFVLIVVVDRVEGLLMGLIFGVGLDLAVGHGFRLDFVQFAPSIAKDAGLLDLEQAQRPCDLADGSAFHRLAISVGEDLTVAFEVFDRPLEEPSAGVFVGENEVGRVRYFEVDFFVEADERLDAG